MQSKSRCFGVSKRLQNSSSLGTEDASQLAARFFNYFGQVNIFRPSFIRDFNDNTLATARKCLVVTVSSAIFVAVCIVWTDYPLASLIDRTLVRHHITTTKINIPDLLLPGCIALVIIAWASYCFCKLTGRFPSVVRLALSIGTVTPCVYVVKEIAQHFFGRVYPRAILLHPQLQQFRFFHENFVRGGFPSGHMMVITPLLLMLCGFSPKLRLIWIGLGLALGAALIATNYHFLGDVIAGAYLGFVADRAWLVMSGASMRRFIKHHRDALTIRS